MLHSSRVYQFGPPDVLTVENIPKPQAGPGQLVIAVEAAGVLFAETQARAGNFPNAKRGGFIRFDNITRDVSFSCGIQSRRISA
jgi:NADPH:quinone reductase-like Zn-dependent oxidoreductase